MSPTFQADFAHINQLRSQLMGVIAQATTELETADQEQPERSGLLELSRHIKALGQVTQMLQQKTLRLMVLGDLKRGKSTLINALLGEPVLPSDVTPCTALLTVLKYGETKQVTLHYYDERSPQPIDFETFKADYTIDPAEAKRLDESGTQAFPDISHAVIEFPLSLLEDGLEIIDSPGLNDTEARNKLALEFMQDCHGVVFVMDATQPMTLDERRYLTNYLKGRGLPIFYVVNQWDRLEKNVLDGSAEDAMTRVREVFRTQLVTLGLETPENLSSRLFELSALSVLRSRVKTPEAPVEGEFARLTAALSQFVTQDRFAAECGFARHQLQLVSQQVQETADKRMLLLDETVQSLELKLVDIQQEFDHLAEIRDQFQGLIRTKRDREVEAIARSFRDYILGLEETFEDDFVKSQPDLDFLKFLQKDSREEFYRQFRRAFERYMNDRLSAWEFMAKQQISKAFEELNAEADEYRVAYSQVVDAINQKLLGDRFYAFGNRYDPEKNSLWVDAIQDLFSIIPDQLNNAVGGFNGFWQRILETTIAYVCIVLALQVIGLIFSSMALNIFAVVLAGAGVLTLQAEMVRQEFLKTTQREFSKYLPQIADEQQTPIKEATQRCFDTFEVELVDRINSDIAARRGELTNLIEKKQNHSLESQSETQRLQALIQAMKSAQSDLEAIAS